MDLIDFELSCRSAGELLGLKDPAALARGGRIALDGVLMEAAFVDGRDSVLLLAELGAIAPEDRAAVYESLLGMQLEAGDEPLLRFGFHPVHESAVLCMDAVLPPKARGACLAAHLRSMAARIVHWRRTVLAGRVRSSRIPPA